jgi:DNA-binding LacI/PurR family transcriptional regulator
MATVKDVAFEAGVSIATVSRVLNGKGRYSSETERLVREAAERLGYTANLPARSLKTGVARTIGIVAGESTLRHSPDLLLAAAIVLESGGFGIQLFPNAALGDCVTLAREGRVDGLLLVEADRDDRALARLIETGRHFVFLGGDIEREDVNLVEIDFFQGGYLATQHLLHLGHRDILVAGGRAAFPPLPAREIMRGYLFALDESGIQYREELTGRIGSAEHETGQDPGPVPQSSPSARELPEREGYEAVARAMESGDSYAHFSAVLATGDRIAYGALRAFEDMGLRVPEDRSVVGLGDADPSAYLHRPLTTVDVPITQMGELGAEILVNNILRKDAIVKRVKLKVHLIQRATTAKMLTG